MQKEMEHNYLHVDRRKLLVCTCFYAASLAVPWRKVPILQWNGPRSYLNYLYIQSICFCGHHNSLVTVS